MTIIGKSLWNMEVFIEMGKGACDGYYLYIDKKKSIAQEFKSAMKIEEV